MADISTTQAWQDLTDHYSNFQATTLRELFKEENRAEKYTFSAAGLTSTCRRICLTTPPSPSSLH